MSNAFFIHKPRSRARFLAPFLLPRRLPHSTSSGGARTMATTPGRQKPRRSRSATFCFNTGLGRAPYFTILSALPLGVGSEGGRRDRKAANAKEVLSRNAFLNQNNNTCLSTTHFVMITRGAGVAWQISGIDQAPRKSQHHHDGRQRKQHWHQTPALTLGSQQRGGFREAYGDPPSCSPSCATAFEITRQVLSQTQALRAIKTTRF